MEVTIPGGKDFQLGAPGSGSARSKTVVGCWYRAWAFENGTYPGRGSDAEQAAGCFCPQKRVEGLRTVTCNASVWKRVAENLPGGASGQGEFGQKLQARIE
jgi:hypothetical protein